mmetsp:Transcript_28620/g.80705  ORF Transcript_28620/g.80705 Transcript_28620/m.80705 type:complete len:451 (+) Transcript_28620:194-1546(+)
MQHRLDRFTVRLGQMVVHHLGIEFEDAQHLGRSVTDIDLHLHRLFLVLVFARLAVAFLFAICIFRLVVAVFFFVFIPNIVNVHDLSRTNQIVHTAIVLHDLTQHPVHLFGVEDRGAVLLVEHHVHVFRGGFQIFRVHAQLLQPFVDGLHQRKRVQKVVERRSGNDVHVVHDGCCERRACLRCLEIENWRRRERNHLEMLDVLLQGWNFGSQQQAADGGDTGPQTVAGDEDLVPCRNQQLREDDLQILGQSTGRQEDAFMAVNLLFLVTFRKRRIQWECDGRPAHIGEEIFKVGRALDADHALLRVLVDRDVVSHRPGQGDRIMPHQGVVDTVQGILQRLLVRNFVVRPVGKLERFVQPLHGLDSLSWRQHLAALRVPALAQFETLLRFCQHFVVPDQRKERQLGATQAERIDLVGEHHQNGVQLFNEDRQRRQIAAGFFCYHRNCVAIHR